MNPLPHEVDGRNAGAPALLVLALPFDGFVAVAAHIFAATLVAEQFVLLTVASGPPCVSSAKLAANNAPTHPLPLSQLAPLAALLTAHETARSYFCLCPETAFE